MTQEPPTTNEGPVTLAGFPNQGAQGAAQSQGNTDVDVGFQSLVGKRTFKDPTRPNSMQFFSDVLEITHTAERLDGTGKEWANLNGNRVGSVTQTQTKNASVTLADIPMSWADDLTTTDTCQVGAGRVFAFRAFIYYTSGTTPDIKFAIKDPSSTGAAITWTCHSAIGAPPLPASAAFGPSGELAAIGPAGGAVAILEGWGTMGATDGAFVIQFAQNTSDASDTTVQQGSRVRVDLY